MIGRCVFRYVMLTRFKQYLGAKLYRMFLWNEEDDKYMGFEEQSISYDDWKNASKKQDTSHYINDYNIIEIEN